MLYIQDARLSLARKIKKGRKCSNLPCVNSVKAEAPALWSYPINAGKRQPRSRPLVPLLKRDAGPALPQCWGSVRDAAPALRQSWTNITFAGTRVPLRVLGQSVLRRPQAARPSAELLSSGFSLYRFVPPLPVEIRAPYPWYPVKDADKSHEISICI